VNYNAIDPQTQVAATAFKAKLGQHFEVEKVLLFGSRARATHSEESDADVAVILPGDSGQFIDTKFAMADLAYEVLLDTGIRIQPLPIWRSQWDHPERYSNPMLLKNIQSEGVVL
jgi:antitoxin ChpS